MKCENLQFNLSLYIDDILTDEERAAVETHLDSCPLCRQKRDDYAALRQSLRRAAAVQVPADLLGSVKNAVAVELRPESFGFSGRNAYFSRPFIEFLQMRVMPYAVGSAAALLFAFSMLWLLVPGAADRSNAELAQARNDSAAVLLTNGASPAITDRFEISPDEVVAERISVSSESPSVNPQGALVALAKSLTGGKIKGDEVVVVADVFGNGLANIEEVVEPLDNEQTVYELEKALEKTSFDAPFVPAFLDRRADSVRVVLKIQRVDVKTTPQVRKIRR